MRIFIITKTNDLWSDRIINNIYERGPSSWVYKIYKYQTIPPLEELLDEREKYLPTKIPECDLVLPLGLPADLVLLLPLIAKKSGAKAAIIPVDNSEQVPLGVQKQLKEEFSEINVDSVFPKPFCSLRTYKRNQFIDEFTKYFGYPLIKIKVSDDLITRVDVIRGAPCGSTWYVAKKLINVRIQDAEYVASLELHNYPCLASREIDPLYRDSIMHMAAYHIKNAVKKAIEDIKKI
ncbi:MAG: DUF166 domain-containing protein [Candidatus Baldrarchaeia archaeon]